MRGLAITDHGHDDRTSGATFRGAGRTMVCGVVELWILLQSSPAMPASLDAARQALAMADTAAAVRTLQALVKPDASFDADEIAALLLLRWIGRSETQRDAAAAWADGVKKAQRGPATWDGAPELMLALRQLETGQHVLSTDSGIVRPPAWVEELRRAAAPEGDRNATWIAAARWVATLGWLAFLDRFVIALPIEHRMGCAEGCLLRELPPPYRTLAARVRAGRSEALDSLWRALGDLRPSPWPYDEFAERLRVTLCALIGLDADTLPCVPATAGLDSTVAAQVQAVRYEFGGRRDLAARTMEQVPRPFAVLDESLDALLDTRKTLVAQSRPGGVTIPILRPPPPPPLAATPALFWRAAWPFYLQPYNARLVAHRARLLLADMSRRFAVDAQEGNLFGAYGWPGVLVRVGVPLAVARAPNEVYRPEGGLTPLSPLIIWVGPTIRETVLKSAGEMEGVSLDLALAARSTVSPTVTTGFVAQDYDTLAPLAHQVVQYLRDQRRQVDVYTAWRAPLACPHPTPRMGFFLLDGGLREVSRVLVSDPMAHPRKKFHLTLAPGPYVYSLEILDPSCRTGERARYVLLVPRSDTTTLSDLMLADELFYGDDELTAIRIPDDVPATVRPSLTVAAGDTVRFYWELYGMPAAEAEAGRIQIQFEVVNVRQQRVPVHNLQKLAEEVQREHGTLDLQYLLTAPPGDGPIGFGLAVGLPADTRGVHVARLRITDTKTKHTATAERAFFVRG